MGDEPYGGTDGVIATISGVLAGVGVVLSVVFVMLYHFGARWEKYSLGRHMMGTSILILLLLGVEALGLVERVTPEGDIIALVATVGLVYITVERTVLLVVTNKKVKENHDREERDPSDAKR